MKILKSIIVVLFLTATIALQAHGTKLTAEERALVLTFRMGKYLQLTEAQKTEIMKIHQNAFEKMDIARQQFTNDKPMMKKARKEIFATRNTELQKILTKEQFDTYVAKQKEEQAKMKKEKEAMKAEREKRKAEKVPATTPNNGGTEPKK